MRGARGARRLCAFARGYNKFEIPPRFGGIFFRIYMYVMETGSASSLSNKPLFMEPNQIKDADILDILFDGRNKEYGAYELRKTYNRRMVKSMVVMVGMLWVRRLRTGSFRVWWLRRRRRR